jgi:hypothetical protein
MSSAKRVTLMFSVNVSRLSQTPPNEVLNSDIFVNENENENYCAFVHENENENFLKNENEN